MFQIFPSTQTEQNLGHFTLSDWRSCLVSFRTLSLAVDSVDSWLWVTMVGVTFLVGGGMSALSVSPCGGGFSHALLLVKYLNRV